jgi:hypothetical protein
MAYRTLMVTPGMSGDADGVADHSATASRLADLLDSRRLQARTAEVMIAYASATGDWKTGQRMADKAIPMARDVAGRTLLP